MAPQSIKLRLPTGGTLIAFTDPSQDVPSDCSRVFSLLPQAAAYMASTKCVLPVLQLIPPLVDVIKASPAFLDPTAGLPRFLKAAEGLAPCLAAVTSVQTTPFANDLLCLIIRALDCVVEEMKALFDLLNDLTRQL